MFICNPAASVERYANSLHRTDDVICASEHYTRGCMQRRNRFLVIHSAVCVAYCTHATEQAINTLIEAQRACEELYVSEPETELRVVPLPDRTKEKNE